MQPCAQGTPVVRMERAEWAARRQAHTEKVGPWVEAHRDRRRRAEPHPVIDFLFTYYSARASTLLNWSPGLGVVLSDAASESWLGSCWRRTLPGGDAFLDPARFPADRVPGLRWMVQLLESVQSRPARYGCHGLHEWAMVYRQAETRHAKTPLRLPRRRIDEIVEAGPLVCSHYDAFRFFTPSARPRNRSQLQPDQRLDVEQSGCLHVNMDLYKWSYKVHPWIDADVMADAFLLAVEAREIDMRASPYDLRALGYEPLCIETEEGRAEYREAQERIHRRAAPIRARLLDALRNLLQPVTAAHASP